MQQVEEVSNFPTPTPSPSPDNLVTILFTGDVMLGRSVNKNIAASQNPSWPFIYVKDILSSADITYINLESPLVSECPVVDNGMKFCGDISNVNGLVEAGVDVASLANNHTNNYGAAGLEETVSTLSSHNISSVGIAGAATISRKGYNYTYLSFNDVGQYPGLSQADSTSMLTQIRSAKTSDNLLIVTFHWGNEYQSEPTARQVGFARDAVDAGADLVIGGHPHWVQTSEIYKGKPIYYSLGNFVFDQEWSPDTKRGLVVRFTYRGYELLRTEELPVLIENYGQPHWQ